MRYLVLSDLHANLQALEAVLADAAAQRFDRILVLGDLVGYGADPGAVIERTVALEPLAMIRRNPGKGCAGLEPPLNFNDVARESVRWTADQLTQAHLDVLVGLPRGPLLIQPDQTGSDTGESPIEICHGAPFDEDYYIFNTNDAAHALETASARICLFGHTHVPGVFVAAEDEDVGGDAVDGELRLPKRGRMLINVGAVGQPRDGDPRAAYGILDTSRSTLALRRVEYDLAGAQARIREAGLPEWLATRLERGI